MASPAKNNLCKLFAERDLDWKKSFKSLDSDFDSTVLLLVVGRVEDCPLDC